MKIHEQKWQGDQNSNYQLIEVWGDQTYRYTIKLDSYKSQSFGRAEVWSVPLMKWEVVHNIPGEALRACQRDEFYARPTYGWFNADLQDLKDVSGKVVEGV